MQLNRSCVRVKPWPRSLVLPSSRLGVRAGAVVYGSKADEREAKSDAHFSRRIRTNSRLLPVCRTCMFAGSIGRRIPTFCRSGYLCPRVSSLHTCGFSRSPGAPPVRLLQFRVRDTGLFRVHAGLQQKRVPRSRRWFSALDSIRCFLCRNALGSCPCSYVLCTLVHKRTSMSGRLTRRRACGLLRQLTSLRMDGRRQKASSTTS